MMFPFDCKVDLLDISTDVILGVPMIIQLVLLANTNNLIVNLTLKCAEFAWNDKVREA